MSKCKRCDYRVSLPIDSLMDNSLTRLKGRRIYITDPHGHHKDRLTSETIDGRQANRINLFLADWLEAAVYAAEEFVDEHGYLPRQPRFQIMMEPDGKHPAGSVRWEKVSESFAIEAFLKTVPVLP